MIAGATLSAGAAEPFCKVLTSASQNIQVQNWKATQRDFGLGRDASFSVRKETLHGGKQEGVEIIVVDNGRLQFTVIPTRGMSVLEVRQGDIRLGWDSPVKEVVHPKLINLRNRAGTGWLEGFNEWMVRCGIEFAGHPGRDRFTNNVGEEAEMDLTLHGKIGNIPASEVEVVVDPEPPHRIRVRGRVDERMFYGPQLELWTEISTEPGSSSFQIDDTLTNRGADEQEFQIIYHANYGPPLLQKGSRFVAALKQVTPFNAHAAKGVQQFSEYSGPTAGFIEQVYCLHPLADADGQTTILLQNAAADQAVSMTFSVDQLPYLTLWKNLAATEAGYVTGLEPGTGFPYNRRIERQLGRVPKLEPGESRRFTIDFSILSGEDVQAVLSRIDQIAGDNQIRIEAQPEVVP